MQFKGISFCSQFITDTVAGPGTYKRGKKPVSALTSENQPIVFRTEDALFDLSTGIYNGIKYDSSALIKDNAAFNNLTRMQGKDCREVAERFKQFERHDPIPVFYPAYIWLQHLHALEYPVKLLCDDKDLIRNHPLFQLLEFNVITSEDMYQISSDTGMVSPYKEDHPDFLFPRSFNKEVQDNLYTLIFPD